MKDKFIIKREDFDGQEFRQMMAAGSGRTLWVVYRDGGHFFQVECHKSNLDVVLETSSLGAAIRKFNKI